MAGTASNALRPSGTDGRTIAMFGLGQCARSMLWSTVDLLIGYHFIARTGLSGETAGAILFGTVILSAIPDIFIANWLAGRPDPRRAALMAQAAFGILAAGFALLLFGPKPEGDVAAVCYICLTSFLFRFAYAAYDVSQNALISLLPANGSGITGYVTTKTVMTSVGRLIASLLVFAALLAPDDALADMKLLAITVLPIVASGFCLLRLTRGAPPIASKATPVGWKDFPFRRLTPPIVATFFHYGLLSSASRFLPLHGDETPSSNLAGALILCLVIGTIVGPIIEHVIARHLAKGPMAGVFAAVGASSGFALALPLDDVALLVMAMVYGTATSALANLIWEQVGTIAHDHRVQTGAQIDALAFALLTTMLKLAIALSTLIFGLLIEPYRQGAPIAAWAIGGVLTVGAVGTWIALRHCPPSRAYALT